MEWNRIFLKSISFVEMEFHSRFHWDFWNFCFDWYEKLLFFQYFWIFIRFCRIQKENFYGFQLTIRSTILIIWKHCKYWKCFSEVEFFNGRTFKYEFLIRTHPALVKDFIWKWEKSKKSKFSKIIFGMSYYEDELLRWKMINLMYEK